MFGPKIGLFVRLAALALSVAAAGQERPPAPAGSIERLDPALDAILPVTARIERIATGFQFTEGPVYMREGYLLFSDIPANVIRKWTPDEGAVEFRRPSGYDGTDAPRGAFFGSNELTSDRHGRIIVCEHGNRRVTRLEKNGAVTCWPRRTTASVSTAPTTWWSNPTAPFTSRTRPPVCAGRTRTRRKNCRTTASIASRRTAD